MNRSRAAVLSALVFITGRDLENYKKSLYTLFDSGLLTREELQELIERHEKK